MKKSHLALAGLAILGLIATVVAADKSESANEGVFIHISHGAEDPHRVLMALNMADMMSNSHDVLVYFDIKAVGVVLKESEEMTYSHFPSLITQLSALHEKGVTLMACPGCLKSAGKTQSDLAPNVELANKENFFSFTKGRILTLDY